MKFPARLLCKMLALVLACFCGNMRLAHAQEPSGFQSISQNSTTQQPPATQAPQTGSQTSATNQPQEAAPGLTIRQTVRRVIVDVTVRDSSGKPVRGLTAKDFSLSEDKQPQRILSFDVYDFDKPSISRGPHAPPLPPNVFVNVPAEPERGPLYVMLYDLVNTLPDDQMTARQQIVKFIRSKPAGTRFALFVTTDKLRLIQGFTDDKDLLYACLDPSDRKPRIPKVFLLGSNYGRGDPYTSLDMLTHLGQYLDGIPGRKNLIWIAGQFEIALFPREGDPADLQERIKSEINALAQAQLAVFPVDVRGVVVNPEGALTGARPNGGASNMSDPGASNAPDPSSNSNPTNNPVLQGMQAVGKGGSLNRSYATADGIASMTGGQAFYSTNDVTEALSEATEQGGSYYTLTYAPPGSMDDGRCHNIGVKLAKVGYQLSYRSTYCHSPLVTTPPDDFESEVSAPLVFPLQAGDVLQGNMRPGAPMLHDLIFSAHVKTDGPPALATTMQMTELEKQADFYRSHRKPNSEEYVHPVQVQKYAIDFRVLDPQFKAAAARRGKEPTLEFAVAAFDIDGRTLNASVNNAVLENAGLSGENKSGLYRIHQSLVVPVKAISIRVGVRDLISDRMGTIEIPLPLKPAPVAH